jgi:hypothetical protein
MLNNETLDQAAAAMDQAPRAGGAQGCCRAYVVLVGLDRSTRQRVKGWASLRKRIFTGRQGHVSDGIYVGYDNATGIERGRAEAFAAALKAQGVRCYAEWVGD